MWLGKAWTLWVDPTEEIPTIAVFVRFYRGKRYL